MPCCSHKCSANRLNEIDNVVFFNYQKRSEVTGSFWNYSKVYKLWFFLSCPLTYHLIFHFKSFTEKAWHFFISFPPTTHVGIVYYILLVVQSPVIVELVRAKVSGNLHYIWVSLATQLGEDCEPWRGECLVYRTNSRNAIKKEHSGARQWCSR